MAEFFHSVTLDIDACTGCTNCIKRCPTEAIRVRRGKAYIITERCIDCGECIRICPHHAKRAIYDPVSMMEEYRYTVALPAPSLYGQFNNITDVDIILTGLLRMGFDDIYEVSRAAELVTEETKRMIREGEVDTPLISSACPAILRIIRTRFPELLPRVLPLDAPIEVAAELARQRAVEATGFRKDEIGVFFLSPCPAKVTAVKMPLGKEQSGIDGVFAISDIYPRLLPRLLPHLSSDALESLAQSGRRGISWGGSGGEASGLSGDNYLAADGIENCIQVLEDLENEQFTDVEFIELNACPGGCVGGVLTVENPYIASTKLKKLRKNLPDFGLKVPGDDPGDMHWDSPVEFADVFKLSDDMETAIGMVEHIRQIEEDLPGLDCGSCGSPTCRALAEDIVKGYNKETDCIYKIKDQMETIMNRMAEMMPGRILDDDNDKKE